MIIDFHTHAFPDAMAEKTIATLSRIGNLSPHRGGTLASLKESMRAGGIDASVVLPIATAPRQVTTINALSYQLNGKDGVYYAGTIHPDSEGVEDILEEIRDHGLFGIKIHPDYQGVYFNDERYVRILCEAAKRDLVVVTHAGRDIGFPDDIHCTPNHVLEVMAATGDLLKGRLVLAHMGACDQPEEALEKLAPLDVYFDTAFVLDRYPGEMLLRLIRAHGADKVLFATDSPWAPQGRFVALLKSLSLTPEEEEMILEKNASRLLGFSTLTP